MKFVTRTTRGTRAPGDPVGRLISQSTSADMTNHLKQGIQGKKGLTIECSVAANLTMNLQASQLGQQ